MAFWNRRELEAMGFKSLGKDVLVSKSAAIYWPNLISIDDYSRIDDFCVLSGEISIGRNVHIAVFCNVAAGRSRIVLNDFVGLAFGCHLIAQSDDYSGMTMTNPTVPTEFKNEISSPISIGRHSILGTGSIVLPGVEIPDGVSSGANTLFRENPEPWSVYVGSPARRIKERSRNLLNLENRYLSGNE